MAKLPRLDWIGSARPSHPILSFRISTISIISTKLCSSLALSFHFKMRPARCVWSCSRPFATSAARRVKPSVTDQAESAKTTEGLNRYSRTVTQPKDQGASQVSLPFNLEASAIIAREYETIPRVSIPPRFMRLLHRICACDNNSPLRCPFDCRGTRPRQEPWRLPSCSHHISGTPTCNRVLYFK